MTDLTRLLPIALLLALCAPHAWANQRQARPTPILLPAIQDTDRTLGAQPLRQLLDDWTRLNPRTPDDQQLRSLREQLFLAVAQHPLSPEQRQLADRLCLALEHAQRRLDAQRRFEQPLDSTERLQDALDAAHRLQTLRRDFPALASPAALADEPDLPDPAGLEFAALLDDATPLRPLTHDWHTRTAPDGAITLSRQFTVAPDEQNLMLNFHALGKDATVTVNGQTLPHLPQPGNASFRVSLPPDHNGTYTVTLHIPSPLPGDRKPAPWLSQTRDGRRDRGR
ncbi:MAG: hypothetical protein ACI4WT_05445 [Oligosphaeraceae bacterium]